jgi:FixJ family two-component response regulator
MVVLLDYDVPVMDSAEVLTALADGDGHLATRHAVIVLTAVDLAVVMSCVLRVHPEGSVPVKQKPYELKALLAAVEAASTRLDDPHAAEPYGS